MKIAILLRGHIRKSNEILENFKNNLIINNSNLEIIIFIHTWDLVNKGFPDKVNYDELKKKYNILSNDNIIMENQDNVKETPLFYNNANIKKFRYQLHAIHKLKEMVQNYELNNNIKFDYFFFTRFDLNYSMNLSTIIEKMGKNNILTIDNFIYYDLYAFVDRVAFEKYGDMYLLPSKKIKNMYKSYGVNPIIDYIIKKNNFNHVKINIASLYR